MDVVILSFCPELTVPNAQSIPVALVGLSSKKVVLIAMDSHQTPGDPISQRIFNQLFASLKEIMVIQIKEVGSKNFISWFGLRFRHSFHVSEVILGLTIKESITIAAAELFRERRKDGKLLCDSWEV